MEWTTLHHRFFPGFILEPVEIFARRQIHTTLSPASPHLQEARSSLDASHMQVMADQAQQLRSRDKIISEMRLRQQALVGAHFQLLNLNQGTQAAIKSHPACHQGIRAWSACSGAAKRHLTCPCGPRVPTSKPSRLGSSAATGSGLTIACSARSLVSED